jgi:RND family efflux transporter MFP subunit
LIAAGCSASAHEEVAPELPRIQVRTVESLAQAGDQWVAGAVAAAEHAVVSTRVSASVRSVAVQEGSRVRRGALLAQLADDDLRAQLAAARTAASAAAAHAKRIETLAREGQATRSELESAQAQNAQAEAQVAAAREALSYAAIRAPFDGVVQSKRISTGDLVGPGQPLFELHGAELEIAGSLDEAEARSLRLGQQLHFSAGTHTGTAAISALAPGGDPLSHRGTVRARVVTGGQGLRTGDFARLEIPRTTPAPSTNLWVPRSALVERGDLTGVFVAREGRAELRWLALGEPAGGAVPVRAGLRAGEEVIDAPGLLRDGQPVEVMRGR